MLDAGKYDETGNFKWFSQIFDSDASTLSAQTDVLPLLWLSAKWLQQEEVSGCLTVMHDVTRRIMNRPVISNAAESERLMASKVAESLEERIIGAVAPVFRPRVTQLSRS